MQNQKQPKGFSLIELLLVFAVIIGIVLASYHRYQQYTLDKDIAAVQQNAALLMNAANERYAHLSSFKEQNKNPAFRDDDLSKMPALNNAWIFLTGLWPQNLLSSNLVKAGNLKIPTKDSPYVVSASKGINLPNQRIGI
jgi:type II secretory pathway pseudopilin PulG